MAKYIIASDGEQDLVCDTGSLNYVPDPVRNRYGVSTRRPVEDWLLTQLDFIKLQFPQQEIFTLGTSCVFGEKFVTHLTACEVDIKPGSFEELRRAVHELDQAIRRKLGAMWSWEICSIGGSNRDHAVLFIGWLDFAYFVQHRKDFLDVSHNRFMGAFAAGQSRSTDYKVLHDGTIVEFDPQKLSDEEREVFEHADEIRFEVVLHERPEKRVPVTMV